MDMTTADKADVFVFFTLVLLWAGLMLLAWVAFGGVIGEDKMGSIAGGGVSCLIGFGFGRWSQRRQDSGKGT